MGKNQPSKPAPRAIRRANTQRVVQARFRLLKSHEAIFKDATTGTSPFPLPEPGTLASEGPYGGCSKAKMCPCCNGGEPFKDKVLKQTVREELKQL